MCCFVGSKGDVIRTYFTTQYNNFYAYDISEYFNIYYGT